ncbi:MAG: hypothetical protein VKJ64_19500, partial [Leptolyngbyaceae bacterium]|nr:hypothetical protein [Leptolyngbyaceae bacterium]
TMEVVLLNLCEGLGKWSENGIRRRERLLIGNTVSEFLVQRCQERTLVGVEATNRSVMGLAITLKIPKYICD